MDRFLFGYHIAVDLDKLYRFGVVELPEKVTDVFEDHKMSRHLDAPVVERYEARKHQNKENRYSGMGRWI